MQQYQISDYPLCIEPTAEILEIAQGSSNKTWAPLYRVPTPTVLTRLCGVPSGLSHFFGKSKELSENPFLLGYTSGGRLSHVLRQEREQQWDAHCIPIEATGAPVVKPSVRLVFQTERARFAFVNYLQQIIDKRSRNPSLESVLAQLAEPPRIVEVWHQS